MLKKSKDFKKLLVYMYIKHTQTIFKILLLLVLKLHCGGFHFITYRVLHKLKCFSY